VGQKFHQFDRTKAAPAFEDCKAMFERNYKALKAIDHDPKFIAADSLGMWIAWNVLERKPGDTEQERQFVRVVGGAVVHSFFSWWSDK
jgi:hypothetical protein